MSEKRPFGFRFPSMPLDEGIIIWSGYLPMKGKKMSNDNPNGRKMWIQKECLAMGCKDFTLWTSKPNFDNFDNLEQVTVFTPEELRHLIFECYQQGKTPGGHYIEILKRYGVDGK